MFVLLNILQIAHESCFSRTKFNQTERGEKREEQGRKVWACSYIIWARGQAKFMHHPVGFEAFGSSTSIVHKRFLQPDAVDPTRGVNGLVRASGLPKPRASHSVGPCAVSVFPVPSTEKVPFFLPNSCQPCSIGHQKGSVELHIKKAEY